LEPEAPIPTPFPGIDAWRDNDFAGKNTPLGDHG